MQNDSLLKIEFILSMPNSLRPQHFTLPNKGTLGYKHLAF